MTDLADKRPSGCASSATGHRFGTLELRELLAVRGEVGLWLAEDDDGDRSLLRLYPGLPTVREWHALELATSRLRYAADARLVPLQEVALDVWPRVTFACSDAEPLPRRIARAPLAPEAAVALCADVAGALAVLERVGVLPVDIAPADIVLVGERARLLADVGLPGGQLAHACVDPDHLAPERAAAIADRARGVRAEHADAAYPTAQSMTYALASIASAAIRGPQPAGADPVGGPGVAGVAPATPQAQFERVLRRGLAHSPSERYETPAALVEALGEAIGAPVRQRSPRARRGPRARGARAGAPRRATRTERRRAGVAIPAAVALVAAAIGAAAGLATSTPEPPAPVTLRAAGVTVEAPHGWLRAAPGETLPAIGAPALVARPPARSPATALAITRTAAPLLVRVADAAPQPVRLGRYDAWRYADIALGAGSVADVYVLADGEGPIVAACLGPAGAPAALRAPCAAALTTVRLAAGRALPLGGAATTRRALARVVADLDAVREDARRALADAKTGRRQAAAADRLSAAYAHAAAAAGRIGTVGAPGDSAHLAARLAETGRAYAALATAARTTRRSGYAQAQTRVVAQERALQQQLAALAAAGPSR